MILTGRISTTFNCVGHYARNLCVLISSKSCVKWKVRSEHPSLPDCDSSTSDEYHVMFKLEWSGAGYRFSCALDDFEGYPPAVFKDVQMTKHRYGMSGGRRSWLQDQVLVPGPGKRSGISYACTNSLKKQRNERILQTQQEVFRLSNVTVTILIEEILQRISASSKPSVVGNHYLTRIRHRRPVSVFGSCKFRYGSQANS